MPGWSIAMIIIMVISTVLSIVLRPKNNIPKLLPDNLANIPIAEQGVPIPVVFGRRFVRQPNVVYYGRVHAEPITVQTGGMSGS